MLIACLIFLFPLLECKTFETQTYSLLYPQLLARFPAYSQKELNRYWINSFMNKFAGIDKSQVLMSGMILVKQVTQ